MIAMLEGTDLLIVLAIGLLLFGGTKLPQLARSLGEAKRELEKGARGPEPLPAPVVTQQPVVMVHEPVAVPVAPQPVDHTHQA